MTVSQLRLLFLPSRLSVLVIPSTTQVLFPLIFSYLDIYVSVVSWDHAVCAKGIYIAIASTTVETENPEEELAPAIDLLGDIIERFDEVSDTYEPVADGKEDHCYISTSYDATR